jgi:hypothetical protein
LTERVEFQHLSQTLQGFDGLISRNIPVSQGEITGGIVRMALRKGAQELFPPGLVIELSKGGLHIAKGQKQPFRPMPGQGIPDPERLR